MTAKEYIEKEINDEDFEIIWESEFSQPISLKEMAKYMEAYHKAKVEATKYKCTDDLRSAYNGKQISKCVMHTDVGYDYFTDDYVLWLEEQLLKQ